MWIQELRWNAAAGWQADGVANRADADLVLYFGNRDALRCQTRFAELRSAYPAAKIVGSSAMQSIVGDAIREDGIVAVALGFAGTTVAVTHARVGESWESFSAGESIGKALAAADLAGVFVIADGLRANGSDLTAGLQAALGPGPIVIGGMASDSHDDAEVLIGADFAARSGVVAAIGFYGDAIRFTHGRASGWDAFGPRRSITRSAGNVVYELDGKPAFELYERYLAEELSGGNPALSVFPLLVSPRDNPDRAVVRANIGVDKVTGAMTFAGNVPEGWSARLMRGNIDRLILASAEAGRQARVEYKPGTPSLALIVGCVGRALLLGERTEEELEAAGAKLAAPSTRIGFYSHGEIAPTSNARLSDVHNQTMTITSLHEVEDD
jgi:hypothetical protein